MPTTSTHSGAGARGGGGLRREMISLEPVRMVHMRRGGGGNLKNTEAAPAARTKGAAFAPAGWQLHVLELSNADQMYDYCNSVALFYDVQPSKPAAGNEGKPGCGGRENGTADDDDHPAVRLRAALEELLVHYPAAAGRVCYNESEGRLEVRYCLPDALPPGPALPAVSDQRHCGENGSCGGGFAGGVPFLIAHANIALRDLGDVSVPHPSHDLLHPPYAELSCLFLPQHPDVLSLDAAAAKTCHPPPRPVMAIQVTSFTCGSFCLAHTCHHAFMDGYGSATFLRNLCSIARGVGLMAPPDFSISRREVLKPRTPPAPSPKVNHSDVIRCLPREKVAVASVEQQLVYGTPISFEFPHAALEALRLRASNFDPDKAKLCSRFQALVALLWTARAKSLVATSNRASHNCSNGSAPSSPRLPDKLNLHFPINLRDKGIPGLTQAYTGNAVFQFSMTATLQELCESSLHCLVSKLRSALIGIDLRECAQSETDYIELKLREGLIPYIDHECLGMPSLVGLPFYDTDCGWGRPIYCGYPNKQRVQRISIRDHPATGAWNVRAVFKSPEEQAAFRREIVEYIVK